MLIRHWLSNLQRTFIRSDQRLRSRRPINCVQKLEDRTLLVQYVDTLVDESDGDFSAGDLSLREAVERANAQPGHDTIRFSESIDVDLSLYVAEFHLPLGTLEITDDVTIIGGRVGLGRVPVMVISQNLERAFHVHSGTVATLEDLQIDQRGSITGGGRHLERGESHAPRHLPGAPEFRHTGRCSPQ